VVIPERPTECAVFNVIAGILSHLAPFTMPLSFN
jgi:hypothetical protein